jgi:hypothetical protein
LFWYFEVLEFSIFFLSFWVFNFVWSFTSEKMRYVPFFLWILKVFHFGILKYSIFFLSFLRFQMGGNNVGGIFLKFGGIFKKNDGVQGSSTLLLKFLVFFPICFSELELVVPFCLCHLTNVFIKPVMPKRNWINIIHIVLTHGNILS